MIAKVADIKPLVEKGRVNPSSAFSELRRLAAADAWQTREVAATALVEIGKRHPEAVASEARAWAAAPDANIRRAASEGLRGIVKQDPRLVWPVLERLRADPSEYVRKSVANVLRNASSRFPVEVLARCEAWSKSADVRTRWIVKHGTRTLINTHSAEVRRILATAQSAI